MLRCFVLIDLKMTKLTHQDIGQMDMYVRIYEDLHKQPYYWFDSLHQEK